MIFSSVGKDLSPSPKSSIPNYQVPIAPYQSRYFIEKMGLKPRASSTALD